MSKKEVIMYIDDEKSRKTIVKDLNHNYFVEASAGSGKTTSLVLRMVALIESGVPVDKICTITFTKAAANEFFSRFQSLLSIRSVNVPDKTDKDLGEKTKISVQRCQDALANIDLCFLGTIDAFLNVVAHELPFELHLPSDSEVVSKDDKNKLVMEHYEWILKNISHPYHSKAVRFNDLFYKSREAFVKSLNVLSANRNFKIIYDEKLCDSDVNQYFTKEEKKDFIRYVKLLCSNDVVYKNTSSGKNPKYKNQATLRTLLRFIDVDDWNNSIADISFALRQIKAMDGVYKTADGSPLTHSGLFDVLEKGKQNLKYSEASKKLFETIEHKVDNYKHSVLFDFVTSVVDEVSEELKEQGALDFFDYLYYVTNEFRKSASSDRILVDHILERHSHFLLDESQDTNPMQTELFFYLTGTKITDDWTKTEPKEGSLFIVGDPKQSIYGFRGANVQAYLKTKSLFEKKNQVLILTKNFRSRAILKDWFNTSMNIVLNHGVEAIEHLDIPVDQKQRDEENALFDFEGKKLPLEQGVYRYFVDKKEDAEAVAKFISYLVNDKETIIIKKNKEIGNVSYGDIRIVPYGTKVDKYVAALTKYNIPMIIEAQIPFSESQTLVIIKELLYLLKDPSDKTAFINVMFSDLYKLNDYDILKMKLDGFDLDVSKEPILFKEVKYQEIIENLHKAYLNTKNMSFSSTLLYLLNDESLNIFKHCDSNYLEYTFFLIEKVKEREEAGLMSGLKQCKDFIENFIENNKDDNRTLRFKNDLDRVILSNLHKVKGLQAPIVFLAGPAIGKKDASQYIDYQAEEPNIKIKEITGEGFNVTIAKRHDISEEETDKWNEYLKAEKERVEYVGATRAESVLFVSSATKLDADEVGPWTDLVNTIDDVNTKRVPDVVPSEPVFYDVSLGAFNKNDKCNNQSVKYHSPSRIDGDYKLSSLNSNEDEINTDIEVREDATLIGTMVHKLMQIIVESKNSIKNADLLFKQIADDYIAEQYINLLKDVYEIMTSGGYPQKNSAVEQNILDVLMKAEEVLCETPFSYKRKDGTIVSGIIDLIYKDDSGYHIIDYKTNQEDDVSILEKEYAGQLSDYQEALKEFGIDADAHIYHIDVK